MRKAHYFSGITLSLFIGAHLLNHLIIYAGEEAHIHFMEAIRPVYRNPVVEILLLAAVLLQVFSGIKLAKAKKRLKLYDRLHVYSGWYLSFFLIAHTSAVLIGRNYLGLDTNLYFGAATFNLWILPLFFIPYYSLSILAFFTHVACIHRTKMRIKNPDQNYDRQAKLIILVGAVITVATVIGMIGIEIPTEYRAPYGL